MKKNFKFIYVGIFFMLFMINFLSLTFASVEVFSNYDTSLKITSNNTIEINKSLTLKNVYDVGIVPGQIEFKIGRGTDGSINKIKLEDIKAVDSFGNEIKTHLRETDKYSTIVLDIFYPLLPGFEYDFNLYYTLSFESGGIFFKSLQIPLRESTIPIEKGNFKVELPENYHFTYLSSEGVNSSINGNVATWDIKKDLPKEVNFEYSYLPVSIGNIRGSYFFWITINIILLLILIIEIRREIRRLRQEYGE